MNIEIVVALISFSGVAISALIAFIIGKKQARVEIEKVLLEVKATYQEKLYEKRLQVYPQLYEILGALGGKILEGTATVDDVKSTWDAMRIWDRQNALFLSPFSTRNLLALRKVVIDMSKLPPGKFSRTKQKEKLLPLLIDMQMSLKTELGVLHADSFHNPSQFKTLRRAIPGGSDE